MSQLFYPAKRTTLHIPNTGPPHDPGRGHLHFVINNPCENGLNLLVSLDSFYPNCDGTCVLVGGHPFITKKSFILYAKADTVETKGTSKNALWRQNRGIGRHAALGLSVSVALERLV